MEKRNGKTVSVIVPVHDGEEYLERCINCLIRQTWEDTEILLIDDGSMDRSGEICDDFAKKYGKIRAVHTENGGVSAARNLGLEACEGDYVTFVDADDCPAADMVEHLVHILEKTCSDVAGCDFWTFGASDDGALDGGKNGGNPVLSKQAEVLNGLEFIEKGILKSDTRCWSKLYRKESIGGIRFAKELTIGEDMLFLLELAKEGRTFSRSGYKGYGYFINDKGAMMHGFRDSYIDQIICWEKALEILETASLKLKDKAEAILLVSTMLVVGKLAMLSRKERKEKKEYVERCSDVVKKYGGHKEAFRELSKGYRVKTLVYRYMPWGYMGMYHLRRLFSFQLRCYDKAQK